MPVMSKQGLPPLYYIDFKAFLFAKGLDYGLLSACWGGTEQDHMLGYCVPHSPKVTIDEKILLVLEVWWIWFVFSVKKAHWSATREAGPVWSKTQKDYWTLLLFFSSSSKPNSDCVFESSRHCHVVFTKDYATMCSVCQMMTKAWSVIYARVFIFFLISLMISSYINFNKFLRICWCFLIFNDLLTEHEHTCMKTYIN